MGEPDCAASYRHDKKVRKRWIKSVGGVAAPLLAGFSFTAVIAISADPGRFRWPGQAALALTLASILLIVAVQAAKRADARSPRASSPLAARSRWRLADPWYLWMRPAYHTGIVLILLGLGFVLFPRQAAQGHGWLLAASRLAFAACLAECVFIIGGCWQQWIKARQEPRGCAPGTAESTASK
jgi:hypothetical protein